MASAAVAQRPAAASSSAVAVRAASPPPNHVPLDRWQFEEFLQCMICFESFNNPKMLKCGHTFCAGCLEGYQKCYAVQKRAEPGKLPCPTCRELTTLPSNGVAGLRNDFKIRQIADLFSTMNIRQRQERLPPVPAPRVGGKVPSPRSAVNDEAGADCSVCQSQKKVSKAQVRCTDCSRYYCNACLQKHNSNALFRGHSVVTLNTHPAALGAMISDLHCKKHPGEQGKYLCRTCEMVVCVVCVLQDHSDHSAAEVSAIVKQQQQDVKNARAMLQRKQEALKKRCSELESVRQVSSSSYSAAEQAIKARAKLMIDDIRKKEAAMLDELRKLKESRLTSLNKELEQVRSHVTKALSADQLAAASSSSTAVRLMSVHEELLLRLRTVAEADTPLHDDEPISPSKVQFLPGRMDSPDIGRIDEIKGPSNDRQRQTPPRADRPGPQPVKRPAQNSASAPASVLAPSSPGHSPQGLSNSSSASVLSAPAVNGANPVCRPLDQNHVARGGKARLVFSVSGYGSRPGELSDPLCVGCLVNGEIVVGEWTNRRLQVFDPTSGKSKRCIASGLIGPLGLAVTLKGNLIVSDATQKRMQVFAPDGQSLSKWGLGKFHNPCGVAVSANGYCIVSDTGDHAVSVYQGEKTCLRRFGSKGAGDDQFDCPLYVCTGRHNEIIVSDSNNHCIKMFTSAGKFVRRIGSEGEGGGQFRNPRGVCTDQEGNIIVADRGNDRVTLVTTQGRFIRHLVTKEDGCRSPYGVAISIYGHLVITENGSNNKVALRVFQL